MVSHDLYEEVPSPDGLGSNMDEEEGGIAVGKVTPFYSYLVLVLLSLLLLCYCPSSSSCSSYDYFGLEKRFQTPLRSALLCVNAS